jgi:hypothetical protein
MDRAPLLVDTGPGSLHRQQEVARTPAR